MATAGDVNGDGASDVIAGAPFFDNGQIDEGRTFVFLGSAAGLAASPAWTAESNQANAQLGGSVAGAGDVNGDGYDDVIAGAHGYSNGQTQEGRAFVFHGSAAGLATSPAWTAESNQANAQLGGSVAGAGDVNGDGYDDVIAGAVSYDNDQIDEGRAFVFLGSAAGLATAAAWTGESNQSGSAYSLAVATAGDVNGDGFSDVLAGAPQYDGGEAVAGAVFAYLGSASGPATTPSWLRAAAEAGAAFGFAVAAAGDADGDGYADVIIGAPGHDGGGPADQGQALLYRGSAAGLLVTPAWIALSNQAAPSSASRWPRRAT